MPNLNTGLTSEQIMDAFYRALHDMTDEQIQALVATKADTSDVTSAISTAISALDATSKGGSGKYIKEISETDGVISAIAETMDTAPTATSTKAVTSGGVKTYVDNQVANKASIYDVYGVGTAIESGTDLNNLTTAGVYTCQTVTVANTLANTPVSGSAFRLEVKYLNNSSRIRQECYILSDLSTYYARTYTSSGWKPWYMFAGTAVT